MTTNIDEQTHDIRTLRALWLTLGAITLLLVTACGFLWSRYGAQVFLDAATFVWRACF